MRYPVLVAGLAGASVGTELIKALVAAGRYDIYGCDISPRAFGHFQTGVKKTFIVNRERYVDEVLGICRREGISAILPGAEEPLRLLARARREVPLAANHDDLINLDKAELMERLAEAGIALPWTRTIARADDLRGAIPWPCVLKPRRGTSSRLTFLVANAEEAAVFFTLYDEPALLQEYLPGDEYSVCTLAVGADVHAVTMRRHLDAKLSVAYRGRVGVLSNGYAQVTIGDFPVVREAGLRIARALGSQGPLDIQGRIKRGVFVPFDLNARFSGCTYLQTLAGFNEADLFLTYLREGRVSAPRTERGTYLRSLTEVRVPASSDASM